MSVPARRALGAIPLVVLVLTATPVRAEYLRIQIRVFGLDCELCARGLSASIKRLDGVKSVDVSLKKGSVDISLNPGNKLKLSDLRKRIRENGFRSMEATITAVGKFNGSKFEVLGSGESYDVGSPDSDAATTTEATFEVH